MKESALAFKIPWTEQHVRILELQLGRNLDNIRLRHGLPIPERAAGTTETLKPTDEAKP